MTTFLYLVRHAHHDWIGRGIPGRLPGVGLSECGKDQAERLAEWLAGRSVDAIYSSPLQRATETATPLAAKVQLNVQIAPEANELDFGGWTGCLFSDLEDDPLWRKFNNYRAGVRAPGGELILEAQTRMVLLLERLMQEHTGQSVAVIGHNDPIRAALVYYLGMATDGFHRLAVDPASVSCLAFGEWGPQLIFLNLRPDTF